MKWPSFERQPERIQGAVIRYKDEDFVDKGHALALLKITDRFGDYDPAFEQKRGWLTTRGRIVTEKEAREIEERHERRSGNDSELKSDPESTLFKDKNE